MCGKLTRWKQSHIMVGNPRGTVARTPSLLKVEEYKWVFNTFLYSFNTLKANKKYKKKW
jgi:hypothetical protein